MKKFVSYCLIVITVVSLSGCRSSLDTNIIKEFSSKNEYYDSEGFKDYTDYAEYYYENSNKFSESKIYKKVSKIDIEELTEFFEDYSQWIVYRDGYENWFSFDYKSQLKENDYFILNIKNSAEPYGKFHNYDIYYFDVEKSILYYFHNNS